MGKKDGQRLPCSEHPARAWPPRRANALPGRRKERRARLGAVSARPSAARGPSRETALERLGRCVPDPVGQRQVRPRGRGKGHPLAVRKDRLRPPGALRGLRATEGPDGPPRKTRVRATPARPLGSEAGGAGGLAERLVIEEDAVERVVEDAPAGAGRVGARPVFGSPEASSRARPRRRPARRSRRRPRPRLRDAASSVRIRRFRRRGRRERRPEADRRSGSERGRPARRGGPRGRPKFEIGPARAVPVPGRRRRARPAQPRAGSRERPAAPTNRSVGARPRPRGARARARARAGAPDAVGR